MKPVAQLPAVYMPGVPDAKMERGGVEPIAPANGRTLVSPRHMGSEGVAEGVGGGLRLLDVLPVIERVSAALAVLVRVSDALPVADSVLETLSVPVCVPEPVPAPERDKLTAPVCDLECEMLLVPERVHKLLGLSVAV